MSSFDGEDLFGSGPHGFEVGGLSLRHVLKEVPGGQGVQLSGLGRQGRSIIQRGALVADDVTAMQVLIDAVEVKLDGLAHVLVDDLGRSWGDTVMLSFDPKPMVRVGGRVRVSYSIQYMQVRV